MAHTSFSVALLFATVLLFAGFASSAPTMRKDLRTVARATPSATESDDFHGPIMQPSPTPYTDDDVDDMEPSTSPESVLEPSASPELTEGPFASPESVPDPYCKEFGC